MRLAILLLILGVGCTTSNRAPREGEFEIYEQYDGTFIRIAVESGDVCITSLDTGGWICSEEMNMYRELPAEDPQDIPQFDDPRMRRERI